MLMNFIRTTLRHLLRNRVYAGLNIFGLSVGLACFAVIGLWVKQQLGYDRFHENAARIYRVSERVRRETGTTEQAVTPATLAPALLSDLPEVETAVRVDLNGEIVKAGGKQFVEEGIVATEPSFFDVFSFRLLKGNPATALSEPYTVVISESIARKYFGDTDPINTTMRIYLHDAHGDGADYKVTGIIQDCPDNSHLSYSMLISFKTVEVSEPESMTEKGWYESEYYTYVLLKPMTEPTRVAEKFPAFLKQYMRGDGVKGNAGHEFFLTPLTDIHLRSNLLHEMRPGTSMTYVMIFSAIGFIVLILACLNYINLSIAYSTDRFMEVGVRKVMGASPRQLILQYLVESWMLAALALVVSIGWIELSRPLFESIFGLALTGLYTMQVLLTLLAIASVAGVTSGLYPALVLSSFRTVSVLKGQWRKGTSGAWLRKGLVVTQYAITVVLIAGILVVHDQLNYIKEKDLGFDKENLLILARNGSYEVIPGYEAFANELKAHAAIGGVARSNSMIATGLDRSTGMMETATGQREPVNLYTLGVDHDYLPTYKMTLVAGHNFRAGHAPDSSGFIINETAARAFGYTTPDDAVGKFVSLEEREGKVIGVVRDFHYNSLHARIEPAAMFLLKGHFSRIAVRMRGTPGETVDFVTRAWKKHFPNSVVDFSLAEDRLHLPYESEDRFSKIFLVFSVISITIASLGLFALVSYSVEKRTKEIGIRKVLGANVAEITAMLSREFLVLVLVACFVAMPVAWVVMGRWLEDFAYHVRIGTGIFMATGLLAIGVAMVSVAVKTVGAAVRNPVEALRRE